MGARRSPDPADRGDVHVAGKAAQVATNAVPIKVIGVLGDVDDPKQLRAAAPPTPLLSRDWFWLWIGGGAFGS